MSVTVSVSKEERRLERNRCVPQHTKLAGTIDFAAETNGTPVDALAGIDVAGDADVDREDNTIDIAYMRIAALKRVLPPTKLLSLLQLP